MVRVLGDINDTQKATEKEKQKVQTKLFEQNLEYKKERDCLLMENTKIAQEQQRLGLMNQQMVVQAIANLASAIARTLPSPLTPSARAAATGPDAPKPAPGDAEPQRPPAQ